MNDTMQVMNGERVARRIEVTSEKNIKIVLEAWQILHDKPKVVLQREAWKKIASIFPKVNEEDTVWALKMCGSRVFLQEILNAQHPS
jgi:hypothetical protein